MNYEVRKGDYLISTDKRKLKVSTIYNYLKDAYWSKNIPKDIVKKSIKGSICFGVYYGNKQIGFARAITDLATFGYLADVFILPAYQGQGLGQFLIKTIMECPELQGFRSWSLATKDAHSLYAKFGFKPLAEPERRMLKKMIIEY